MRALLRRNWAIVKSPRLFISVCGANKSQIRSVAIHMQHVNRRPWSMSFCPMESAMLLETCLGSSRWRSYATPWMPVAISCVISVSMYWGIAMASHRSAMSLTVPEIHPSSGQRMVSVFRPRENTAYSITNGEPSMPLMLSR